MNNEFTGDEIPQVSIPKLIMQTWKNKTVPEKWKTSPESISKHMSTWSYVLMTDEDNRNFVKDNFPEFLSTYDSYPLAIQRADAIRPMWLYKHGGLYLDLDYEIQENFDHLFYKDMGLFVMNSMNYPSYFTNSVMASSPGHPFWLEVIELMKERAKNVPVWAVTNHFYVMSTTGPLLITDALRKTKHTFAVLPVNELCPTSVCSSCYKSGILKPLEGGSWNKIDTTILNIIQCNPWKSVIIGIAIILLIIWIVYIIVCWLRKK